MSIPATFDRHPLPAWVDEVRPHQQRAITEAVEAFNDGADVVFIDAPTGSGKTLIGQQVAQRLDTPALYVCTDKQLQDQFVKDFGYARVLKGRANYPTQFGHATADDCNATSPMSGCMHCDGYATCPYQVAKQQAIAAQMAVLNTSYFLTEANYVGSFAKQQFVIVEADALESALLGFTEFKIPMWVANELSLTVPRKGVHKPTLAAWLDDVARQTVSHIGRARGGWEPKILRRWQGFAQDVERVRVELLRDIHAGDNSDDAGRWLRDYDTKVFALKPVMVAPYGAKNLWRHSRKWLLMSATIISTDEMVESLGIPLDAYTVHVPMTFPIENRPVVIAPVANVTYKSMDEAVPRLAYAIARICEQHPGERVLVHTVAYGLNDRLVDALRHERGFDRKVVTYRRAADREQALAEYRRTPGAVLLSPSMERGVDLPGDLCRVVVVAKVPFPALGDKRVSARVHLPGGQQWYTVQAIRDVVQMTGRGVRSATDHATTYILDRQFVTNLYGRNEMLFPKWWRDAVDMKRDTRSLLYPQ